MIGSGEALSPTSLGGLCGLLTEGDAGFLGSFLSVCFRLAARAAFLIFLLAVRLCFWVTITCPLITY